MIKDKMDLLIASFRIRFECDDGLSLDPGERFSAFIHEEEGDADVRIRVSAGRYDIPEQAVRVFEAPLAEEDGDRIIITGRPFWSVHRSGATTIVLVADAEGHYVSALEMDDQSLLWRLHPGTTGATADPLVYPLDGLILYYLTLAKGAIMMHASAVNINGQGWIFSGMSGRGKTTIAKIFDNSGYEVIHDDRVILAKTGGRWIAYSTPVYRNDVPRSAPADHIWIIEHGKSNSSVPATGAAAAALVLSNLIQQTWNSESEERLLLSVEDLITTVPVSRLSFVADSTICDYLLLRSDAANETAFGTSLSLLNSGTSITVTAGGSSMWPSVKPGDRVIVEPHDDSDYMPGDVVALIRLGGFVVHRIREVVKEADGISYLTEGDASGPDDRLSAMDEIAGIVREIIRDGRRMKVRRRLLPAWVNRVLALAHHMVKKI